MYLSNIISLIFLILFNILLKNAIAHLNEHTERAINIMKKGSVGANLVKEIQEVLNKLGFENDLLEVGKILLMFDLAKQDHSNVQRFMRILKKYGYEDLLHKQVNVDEQYIKKTYSVIDNDSNGLILIWNIKKKLNRLGYDNSIIEIGHILTKFESEGVHYSSIEVFLNNLEKKGYYKQLKLKNEQDNKLIKRAHDMIEKEGDGLSIVWEIQNKLEELGFKNSLLEVGKILLMFDCEGYRFSNIQEFLKMMEKDLFYDFLYVQNKNESSDETKKYIDRVFHTIENDDEGLVSVWDIQSRLNNMGYKHSLVDVGKILMKYDAEKFRYSNFSQFLSIMENTGFFNLLNRNVTFLENS
ncbi:uncharacterized protein LOC126904054 isoform X2 [Daktulosphaira vitifoliae]|uniref:uncharacterized protein LOC126904054 isoform X2 n=1 Tax=Daktulosphaira vitifoliae TaxID=58002 RepID=UPI0021A9BE63|nr:uncharacterized protein LOC126904054 isoform X2 [Daktulosphaira vitifoliae]